MTEISDLQRLRLEPGDVLVLTVPQGYSSEHIHEIGEAVDSYFPGHRTVVLTEPARLGVITPAEGVA